MYYGNPAAALFQIEHQHSDGTWSTLQPAAGAHSVPVGCAHRAFGSAPRAPRIPIDSQRPAISVIGTSS